MANSSFLLLVIVPKKYRNIEYSVFFGSVFLWLFQPQILLQCSYNILQFEKYLKYKQFLHFVGFVDV